MSLMESQLTNLNKALHQNGRFRASLGDRPLACQAFRRLFTLVYQKLRLTLTIAGLLLANALAKGIALGYLEIDSLNRKGCNPLIG
ncbi:MAG: hypothetical protein EA395_12465 [Phormidium sp. GEM2.Bin31]|nr:MAG: hypothetical protein EA395_12465 [Phormidium sp. GEM2.Bin31]